MYSEYFFHFQLHWLPQPCIRQYIQRRREYYGKTRNTNKPSEINQKLEESNLPEEVVKAQNAFANS